MTITLTAAEFDELKARIAALHDLACFYAPHYAQADVTAVWTDICELTGAADEAAYRLHPDRQLSLFDESWYPV